jgi:hypothetical protein
VFVVDAQKVAHRRDVKGRQVLDDRVELSGLEAGEAVVVERMPSGRNQRAHRRKARAPEKDEK